MADPDEFTRMVPPDSGSPGSGLDFGIPRDSRHSPSRQKQPPKMVPWDGCPLFSSEEVREIPDGTRAMIRLGIATLGEKIPFARKPFPSAIKTSDIRERFGPGEYYAELVVTDPNVTVGSGIRGLPLGEKMFTIPSTSSTDVGKEAWPISVDDVTPRSLIEEIDRRKKIRDELAREAQESREDSSGQTIFMGPRRGQPMFDRGPQRPTYQVERDEEDDQPPGEPLPGTRWAKDVDDDWVLLPDRPQRRAEPRFEVPQQAPPPAAPLPAPAPVRGLVDKILDKPPEEIFALLGGVMKLWQAFSVPSQAPNTSAVSQQLELEKIKSDFELARQKAEQDHQLRMAELKAKLEPAHTQPAAPPVDVAAIRADAEARANQRILEERLKLVQEQLNAKSAVKPPGLFDEIREIKQKYQALGLDKKDGAAKEPSLMDQIADILDTEGGKTIVELVGAKLMGVPVSSPQQQQQQQQQQPQEQQLGDGYGDPQG